MNMQAIKDRRAAISPGKWYTIGQPWTHSSIADTWVKAGNADPHISTFVCDCQSVSDDAFDEPAPDYYRPRANAAFIASAPADIDALVKRVEELEAEKVTANAKLDHYTSEVLTIAVEQESRIKELEAEKRTLKATIQAQMLKSLDKNNEGKNEEHWQGHASALVYVLTLMRQIEEPKKRHTTGNPLPLVEE